MGVGGFKATPGGLCTLHRMMHYNDFKISSISKCLGNIVQSSVVLNI